MKLFLLAILCSACFVHASSQASLSPVHEELIGITKQVTKGILRILASGLQDRDVQGDEFRFPILPNFTDPMPLEDVDVTFANALLSGPFASREAVVTGLSTLKDDLAVVPIVIPAGARATYRLDVTNVALTGIYDSNLDILTGTTLFTGSGDYSINLSGGFIQVDVVLRVINLVRIEITKLEVNLGFQDFHIEAQDALFNQVAPDWTEINEELKRIFDIYWPVLNAKLIAPMKGVINHYIKTCTITELTQGKLECLNDEPLPQITSAPEPEISTDDPTDAETTVTFPEDSSTPEVTGHEGSSTPEVTGPEGSSTPAGDSAGGIPTVSGLLLAIVGIVGLHIY